MRTIATWVKTTQPVIGHWLQGRTEHVTLATRGRPPFQRCDVPNVIEAPRQQHSSKPREFFDLVDATGPGQRRLELFARESRDGWAAWRLEAQAAK